MDDQKLKHLTSLPIKVLSIVITVMILIKFGFVLYDFISSPFPGQYELTERAVSHIITALILLEILALNIQFLTREMLDPNLILISVLTVLGKHLIILNPISDKYAEQLLILGGVFSVIAGLAIFKFWLDSKQPRG